MFITGGKSGEVIEAMARDAAILFSLCRRFGVPVEVMQHGITRDSQGRPVSIIGTAIDLLPGDQT